jgi:hypothetical protein
MASFHCLVVMIWLPLVICTSAAEFNTLLDPSDLPPYPAAGSTEILTHSQKGGRQLLGGTTRSPDTADAEEQALAKSVDDLTEQVHATEEKAYHDDPALLLSDTYQESAHEWVMRRHGTDFNASLNFSRNVPSKEVQNQVNKAVDLIDMILFVELSNNPNFFPLFASVYDAADQMRKTNPLALAQFYNYDRNDKLIGYTSGSPAPSVSSLKEYLVELNKRYPLLLSKFEEIKTEAAIPADALAGLKFGELYRLLDGVAQIAVELRTPKELADLRQKLRTQAIRLANLRGKRKQEQANQ